MKAIADYNKAIELDPKLTMAFRNRGRAFENLRRLDQAIADHSKAIELDPTDPGAFWARGLAEAESNPDQAIGFAAFRMNKNRRLKIQSAVRILDFDFQTV